MARELLRQQLSLGIQFDHLVLACGSGGTAAGLAIGLRLFTLWSNEHDPAKTQSDVDLLGSKVPQLHGICVCDTPEWFYDHIEKMAAASGLEPGPSEKPEAIQTAKSTSIGASGGSSGRSAALGNPRDWISLYQGKGLGFVSVSVFQVLHTRGRVHVHMYSVLVPACRQFVVHGLAWMSHECVLVLPMVSQLCQEHCRRA